MNKGEALRAWRKEHGLTQEEAARLAGASLSGWRSWEAGRAPGPSADVLQALERDHSGLLYRLASMAVVLLALACSGPPGPTDPPAETDAASPYGLLSPCQSIGDCGRLFQTVQGMTSDPQVECVQGLCSFACGHVNGSAPRNELTWGKACSDLGAGCGTGVGTRRFCGLP